MIMSTGSNVITLTTTSPGSVYYYSSPPSPAEQSIEQLRARAQWLKSQVESVDAWRAELRRVNAVLKTWGDK